MTKEVIKAKIVDKIWGDMGEDRGFAGRHALEDEDWTSIRLYLEIAYEAGYREGLDQAAENETFYRNYSNGFDSTAQEDYAIRQETSDPKKKPTT